MSDTDDHYIHLYRKSDGARILCVGPYWFVDTAMNVALSMEFDDDEYYVNVITKAQVPDD